MDQIKEEKCVVCFDKEPDIHFDNCPHICICEKCFIEAKKIMHNTCPLCRKRMKNPGFITKFLYPLAKHHYDNLFKYLFTFLIIIITIQTQCYLVGYSIKMPFKVEKGDPLGIFLHIEQGIDELIQLIKLNNNNTFGIVIKLNNNNTFSMNSSSLKQISGENLDIHIFEIEAPQKHPGFKFATSENGEIIEMYFTLEPLNCLCDYLGFIRISLLNIRILFTLFCKTHGFFFGSAAQEFMGLFIDSWVIIFPILFILFMFGCFFLSHILYKIIFFF